MYVYVSFILYYYKNLQALLDFSWDQEEIAGLFQRRPICRRVLNARAGALHPEGAGSGVQFVGGL